MHIDTYKSPDLHIYMVMHFFPLPQTSMSALVAMVAVNRHAPTLVEATHAPVERDIQKMVFMDVQVIFFGFLLVLLCTDGCSIFISSTCT